MYYHFGMAYVQRLRAPKPRILFVFTSTRTHPKLYARTGYYLPTAAHPYYILLPHAQIDFASPQGTHPPLDPGSLDHWAIKGGDLECIRFLEDRDVRDKMESCKRIGELDWNVYDAVLYVGGHGAMFDLPLDPINARLLENMWENNKIVASVSHGPSALLSAKSSSGCWIFHNKRLTGLSNEEEKMTGHMDEVPFLVEDTMKDLGGIWEAGTAWSSNVVVDGRLITGQNPQSAKAVGEAIKHAIVPY